MLREEGGDRVVRNLFGLREQRGLGDEDESG